MEQQQRSAVVEMTRAGNGPAAIYKALNYP